MKFITLTALDGAPLLVSADKIVRVYPGTVASGDKAMIKAESVTMVECVTGTSYCRETVEEVTTLLMPATNTGSEHDQG